MHHKHVTIHHTDGYRFMKSHRSVCAFVGHWKAQIPPFFLFIHIREIENGTFSVQNECIACRHRWQLEAEQTVHVTLAGHVVWCTSVYVYVCVYTYGYVCMSNVGAMQVECSQLLGVIVEKFVLSWHWMV